MADIQIVVLSYTGSLGNHTQPLLEVGADAVIHHDDDNLLLPVVFNRIPDDARPFVSLRTRERIAEPKGPGPHASPADKTCSECGSPALGAKDTRGAMIRAVFVASKCPSCGKRFCLRCAGKRNFICSCGTGLIDA